MNHLLLFNLATDADDPILGFTTEWINRLAAHVDHIDVITMRAGRIAVAANVSVYSVGKEKGYSEARRAAEFYRILIKLIDKRRYTACFAHMMPLFAVLGAPLLRLRGIPITLWYTHRQNSSILQLAEKVSWRVVTAADDSFPFKTSKLRVIGHGIDTDFFAPAPDAPPPTEFLVAHVARLMPIKHQESLIRAAAAVPEMQVVFVGDVPPQTDATYKTQLEVLAANLGVSDRIVFAGAQNANGVRDWLRRSSAAVNLSPPGLFDKGALESMAVGLPTVVSSTAFQPVLRGQMPFLSIPTPDNHGALALRLAALMRKSPDERRLMGAELRARVIEAHNLDGLITRLIHILTKGEP